MEALRGYRVTSLEVEGYRGIECIASEIGEGGVLVRGRNAGGKTSVLKALGAALGGQDVGADAIRLGCDQSRIRVTIAGPDEDRLLVERVITRATTDVTVRDAAGARVAKAAALLRDLIGRTPNPLDLLEAPRKERAAWVLAACPGTVTLDFCRRFDPAAPDNMDLRGHGLEALARLRDWRYEQRTHANAHARDTAAVAEDAAKRAAGMLYDVNAPTVAEADAAFEAARDALARLEAEADSASKAREKTAKARARVDELREQAAAAAKRAAALSVAQSTLATVVAAEREAADLVTQLEARLARARTELAARQNERAQLEQAARQHDRAKAEAESLARQAADLEQAIDGTSPPEVPEALLERARDRAGRAAQARLAADEAMKARVAQAEAQRLAAVAQDVAAEAKRLDGLVYALTFEAPAALLAENDGIPGLAIEDDDVTLDGVRLDSLSGAEQVRFAVKVAKRVNARRKLRLLVVDGLERLDPEGLAAFLDEATSDGWQIFGSLVNRGDVVIEALGAQKPPPRSG